MADSIYIEILVIVILVIINGVFVISETALVSSRKINLQIMINEGNKKAETALKLLNSPNKFLSTVQIFITLIGILAGTFGGATIAQRLAVYLNQITLFSPYSSAISVIVVVLIITYLTLIIGELVPKRIAIDYSESIAVVVARPIQILSNIVTPIVYFLSTSMELVLKILRVKEPEEEEVAEEQIKLLIEEGRKSGEFEKTEEEMINRIFELDERRIYSMMTPKTDITWLDINEPQDEILKRMFESEHSIFPVSEGYLDNFLGVIQVKDILDALNSGKEFDLKKYLKEPLIVPESSFALNVLKQFKESAENVHMAVIVDEYGDIEGLITLYDILEAIVGDLPTTDDLKAVKRADGSWLIDGLINIDEFKPLFDIEKLPEEEESNYQTLAGFIITYLGKIPDTGESFIWNGFRFEIMDKDGYHIDKVLVSYLAG
ncbi:hemolysin family protein [Methanobacterium sp. ACI-7]|uniref:hemolysin family protein n=1 Tax=unclassified Methanobacterium TaxID=2627676 RepID=UPI0039C0322E